MALSTEQRKELLAAGMPKTRVVIKRLDDYLARTGLTPAEFARRINYSYMSVRTFLAGKYELVASTDDQIRKTITDYIDAHPILVASAPKGKLYETRNAQLLRKLFYEALDEPRAIYVHGAPGSQKSFVLEHLVAELNVREQGSHSMRRAYYVYCAAGMSSLMFLREIAIACGIRSTGDKRAVIRSIRHELGTFRVVLVLDEAQHLKIEHLEVVRELLDRCGISLLFAGSHYLQTVFVKHSLELEQWNSRFYAKASLPGITEEEASMVISSEMGAIAKRAIEQLIGASYAEDLMMGREYRYISARRLFNAIADTNAKQARLAKQARSSSPSPKAFPASPKGAEA